MKLKKITLIILITMALTSQAFANINTNTTNSNFDLKVVGIEFQENQNITAGNYYTPYAHIQINNPELKQGNYFLSFYDGLLVETLTEKFPNETKYETYIPLPWTPKTKGEHALVLYAKADIWDSQENNQAVKYITVKEAIGQEEEPPIIIPVINGTTNITIEPVITTIKPIRNETLIIKPIPIDGHVQPAINRTKNYKEKEATISKKVITNQPAKSFIDKITEAIRSPVKTTESQTIGIQKKAQPEINSNPIRTLFRLIFRW